MAKALPLSGKEDGMDVVYTFCQKHGRGQGTHAWFGGNNRNIAVTFVFEPRFLKTRHLFFLNMALSLGVLRYGRCISEAFLLKWPNDLYWQCKKAGGLLLETSIGFNCIERLCLGVGLNVNQREFPLDIPRPVSLFQIDGQERDLQQETRRLANSVYGAYIEFKESYLAADYGRWQAAYMDALLFRNEWREFVYKGERIAAAIRDVDTWGHLKMENPDGSFFYADIKELQYGFDE